MAESDGYSDEEGRLAAISDEEGRVAAYFPDDFKQYLDTQLNRCPVYDNDFLCGWVYWSREDDQSEHPPKMIKYVLRKRLLCSCGYPTLLQFWAPKMTTDGRSYLTTQNQPFALPRFDRRIDDVKGLCEYKMISMDYKFYIDRESSDEQLGVPGRAFKQGFPEFSPNVEYYSIKEYPLRHHALRCQLKQSWAAPVFDPSAHLCVGVLEMVSTRPSKEFRLHDYFDCLLLVAYLREVGLESSISHAESDLNVRQSQALDEINKVLKVVRGVHDLPLAQVWAPCEVDWTCRALAKGDIFHDVTQLSMIDYPLAHYARDHKLICCLAICLQSSCTGNDIYVLECFMPPSNEGYYGNQQTALRKILETLKKNLRTFKLASGEELGGHLYIEEIPFQNGEKLDSVQMSQTTKSLPRLEPLQSGGEMTQLDLSNQQSMDALNNESNVVSAERGNIYVTCSQEKGKTKRPKRGHNKTGVKIEIPLVSLSTLKRVCRDCVCRDYDIPRWPPHKKNMAGCCQPSESSPGVDHPQIPQLSSDQPFSQALAAVVHANLRNTFPLSLSLGLVELQQQIANRLDLEDGTYYVKYKDEDGDLIVIACDEDLQYYISSSTSPGSTTIIVLIVPK
ncbi:unnamed protein product [Camellia sinensis]